MKPSTLFFWMVSALLALALYLLWSISPAHAGECVTETQIRQSVHMQFPTAIMSTIGDKNLKGFLAAFNAEPPRSEAVADRVLIISDSGMAAINVAFFWHGCMHGHGTINAAQLARFMGVPT